MDKISQQSGKSEKYLMPLLMCTLMPGIIPEILKNFTDMRSYNILHV